MLTEMLQKEKLVDETQGFISDSLLKVADIFTKKITVLPRARRSRKWFDNECKKGRKSVRQSLRKFKRDSSDENRRNYVDNRNKYKLKIKQKKAQEKKEQLDKVVNNMQNSIVLLSEIRAFSRPATVQTNIDSEQWFEHFKVSSCLIVP